jgi:TPR repeat protein
MRKLSALLVISLLLGCAATDDGLSRLPAEAAELSTAAKNGSPAAMEKLGEAFHFAQGVKRDMAVAFIWYERAAKAGLPGAQDYVGLFYAGGLGGAPENCEKSIYWFLKAAEGGNVESKNNAAWMLATCKIDKFRDGKRAIELATEAIAELGPSASYVGTLAAAYAEVGDFHQAVELQEESLSRMRLERASDDLMKEATVRLQYFRAKKPWRGASFDDPERYRPQ